MILYTYYNMLYSFRCRRRSARAAAGLDGVIVEMDQQGVPAVCAVVEAARRIRSARAKVQSVHQRTRRTARLPQTECGPGSEFTNTKYNIIAILYTVYHRLVVVHF